MAMQLSELEPKLVWSIFEKITRIPRCSGKEQQLQHVLEGWAREHGIGFKKDESGNVLLTRLAAIGSEGYPSLVLQSHQDMVCEKNKDSKHNFDTDPIPVEATTLIVRSNGTTLGADNGIGMALSLALLIDDSIKTHGQLEALLTVEEETGLKGALNMKPGFYKSKYMINLDSEEVGEITIGSAGGGGTQFKVLTPKEKLYDYSSFRLEVDRLLGGHSGVDIHLPRANANKVLGSFLFEISKVLPIRLIRFDGGTRGNVIPRSAYCEFGAPKRNVDRVREIYEDWKGRVSEKYPVETGIKFSLSGIPVNEFVSRDATTSVIGIIEGVHHGPFSWDKNIKGLVETSNNLGIVKTSDDHIMVSVSSRSSNPDTMTENRELLKGLGLKYGSEVTQPLASKGWKADPNSDFLKYLEDKYYRVEGKKTIVKAIHAGLECGHFSGMDPDLKVVSIGPTIEHAHSPEESVQVNSVLVVWNLLLNVVESMWQLQTQ